VTERITTRLRAETREVHQRLETELGLVDGELTAARYRDVLARFHGFYAVLEPRLDRWHHAHPVIDWPDRRKLPALAADLRSLGLSAEQVAALPPCPSVPRVDDVAAGLGTLYVVEGATLGGQLLVRELSPVVPSASLAFFASYGPEVGRRWRHWRRVTDAWVGDDVARGDAVVAQATRTFETLRDWLAPVRRERAA
jgi:heme oxygenase